MRRLKDHLWIWGQPAGSHHKVENNMCIVTSGNDPEPPFDGLAEELKECPQVVFSII